MIGVAILIFLSFISIGLNDPLLGGAWPSMYGEFGVDIASAGIIAMCLTGSVAVATFFNARIIRRFGIGIVLPAGLVLVSMAAFGFSFANHFVVLCLLAVVAGFGLGSVDTGGNSFIAVHYSAKYMNWLHCFWALGATVTPILMAFSLNHFGTWRMGYRLTGSIQIIAVVILLLSIPLWKKALDNKENNPEESKDKDEVPGVAKLLSLPGAPLAVLSFILLGGLGATMGLWITTYLVEAREIPREVATGWLSFYFIGVVTSRLCLGFLAIRVHSRQLIYMGIGILAVGIVTIGLPFSWSLQIGLILAGVGMAPLVPNFLYNTKVIFGKRYTGAMISLQMTALFAGVALLPALFGLIGRTFGYFFFPFHIGFLLICTSTITFILHKRYPDKI
jgi:fucose permease